MSAAAVEAFGLDVLIRTALSIAQANIVASTSPDAADKILDALPDITVGLDPTQVLGAMSIRTRMLIGDVAEATGRPEIEVLQAFRDRVAIGGG